MNKLPDDVVELLEVCRSLIIDGIIGSYPKDELCEPPEEVVQRINSLIGTAN